MGLNSFELGLRPQDSFEVIQDFYLNSQHLENIKPSVYTFNWTSSNWFISFYASIFQ